VPREESRKADVVDLKGRPLMPGFCDGHTHLVLAAEQRSGLDLTGVRSLDELKRRIRAEARKKPGEWIVGFGWEMKNLFSACSPSLSILDDMAIKNPIFLESKDAHSAWLNSSALKQALSLESFPDKCSVQIIDGTHTGLVFEDTFQLKDLLVSERPDAEKWPGLQTTVESFFKHGITSIHNFESVAGYRLVASWFENQSTRIRTVWSFMFQDPEELEHNSGLFDEKIPGWLYPGWVKLFLDGSLGSKTAALSVPYVNSDNRGLLTMSDDELEGWAALLDKFHLSAAVHAIGDRAVEMALRGLGRYREGTAGHRIEHVQILSKRILDTCSFGGLTFSVQPSHMWGDREIVETSLQPDIGERYSYPYRTISNRGGRLVFGSDHPIEVLDPWKGIQAAVTRLAGPTNAPWNRDEGISLYDAIRAHTGSFSAMGGHRFQAGRLASGYLADLVVFNEDPFAVYLDAPGSLFGRLRPYLTVLDGSIVYAPLRSKQRSEEQ
ncbi:MAG: amidohydrolase, partial [bacterium]|nr:amidohydrolase [bacterium]